MQVGDRPRREQLLREIQGLVQAGSLRKCSQGKVKLSAQKPNRSLGIRGSFDPEQGFLTFCRRPHLKPGDFAVRIGSRA